MPGYKMMEKGGAPKKSVRPKARPKYMEDEAAAVERGRRAYEREMEDMPPKKMMGGGKVRGYMGGGKVCRGGGAAISGTQFRGVK